MYIHCKATWWKQGLVWGGGGERFGGGKGLRVKFCVGMWYLNPPPPPPSPTHYPFKEASNTNFKKIYIQISKTKN